MAEGIKARFITRKWPPAVGGMETYCVRMSQEISRRCDLEVSYLEGRRDGRGPTFLAIAWFGLSTILGTLLRRRVDVLHLGDMAIWPLGFFERSLGRAERLVLAAHGSDVSTIQRSALYRAYLTLGARLLPGAIVLANSGYIADLAKTVGFTDVSVVPLGTDAVASEQSPQNGLLFAGRISRGKGLRFLVEEVLPLLPPSTVLRVAGPIWESSERDLLEHSQVEYLGALPPAKLGAEYSRAAITLVPSRIDEGFGLVAIEAAACGSQVVASDGGGLREAVRAPWGELVDPNDAEKWAEAIKRRLNLTTEQFASVRQAAMSDIDQHSRWRVAADETFARYAL